MKTHSARWQQNSPTSWILKQTVKNGSAVLATVKTFAYSATWEIHTTPSFGGSNLNRQGAQRAVRRALREAQQ